MTLPDMRPSTIEQAALRKAHRYLEDEPDLKRIIFNLAGLLQTLINLNNYLYDHLLNRKVLAVGGFAVSANDLDLLISPLVYGQPYQEPIENWTVKGHVLCQYQQFILTTESGMRYKFFYVHGVGGMSDNAMVFVGCCTLTDEYIEVIISQYIKDITQLGTQSFSKQFIDVYGNEKSYLIYDDGFTKTRFGAPIKHTALYPKYHTPMKSWPKGLGSIFLENGSVPQVLDSETIVTNIALGKPELLVLKEP